MKIIYNSGIKESAGKLRNNAIKAEIKLWAYLKIKQLTGYGF
jgi:very-short-patch-repair endonuclease